MCWQTNRGLAFQHFGVSYGCGVGLVKKVQSHFGFEFSLASGRFDAFLAAGLARFLAVDWRF